MAATARPGTLAELAQASEVPYSRLWRFFRGGAKLTAEELQRIGGVIRTLDAEGGRVLNRDIEIQVSAPEDGNDGDNGR